MGTVSLQELTDKQIDGLGVFDTLMDSVQVRLDQQYEEGRIHGADYSKVYLGSIEAVLQQAVYFLLNKEKVNTEIDLLKQQIITEAENTRKTANEASLIAEQIQTERLNQNKIGSEIGLLNAQISKTNSEVSVNNAQISRLNAEVTNLNYKNAALSAEATLSTAKATTESSIRTKLNAEASAFSAKVTESNARAKLLLAQTTEATSRASLATAQASEANARASLATAQATESGARAGLLGAQKATEASKQALMVTEGARNTNLANKYVGDKAVADNQVLVLQSECNKITAERYAIQTKYNIDGGDLKNVRGTADAEYDLLTERAKLVTAQTKSERANLDLTVGGEFSAETGTGILKAQKDLLNAQAKAFSAKATLSEKDRLVKAYAATVASAPASTTISITKGDITNPTTL